MKNAIWAACAAALVLSSAPATVMCLIVSFPRQTHVPFSASAGRGSMSLLLGSARGSRLQ